MAQHLSRFAGWRMRAPAHEWNKRCFGKSTRTGRAGALWSEVMDADTRQAFTDADDVFSSHEWNKRCFVERIAEVEDQCAKERMQTGRRVVGRRRILRQSWHDAPTSHEPRRGLRPRVAARSKWARIERLQRDRDFAKRYPAARALWLDGKPVVFPLGTYWLRRFANVPTEPFVSQRPRPVAN
jgi:hypothetical protein